MNERKKVIGLMPLCFLSNIRRKTSRKNWMRIDCPKPRGEHESSWDRLRFVLTRS
ncbi:hypothetical protein Lalb_Chr24g0393011 [Lupinus albus]|uniref:Uncharacterized protein n=1 Tax=Lupinus albus TaxID=3870 RepID=A0A6A4NEA1_LUPAL|nr:hypothetical protein Lalb_Chr24g0393011 [Lupinus albus]